MKFGTGEGEIEFSPRRAIVAGWTGRDAAAVRHHIEELAALGVPPPSATPLYYRVAATLAVQADEIEVVGEETSGEAEPVLFRAGGRVWITAGSDQTDRALEAHSVAKSKQICAKPVAGEAWALDSVADAEALTLRSWIDEGAGWTLYQDGTLAAMLPLSRLIEESGLAEGEIMFCGTITAIGGVRPAPRFRMELGDPATGRAIAHEYRIRALPEIR